MSGKNNINSCSKILKKTISTEDVECMLNSLCANCRLIDFNVKAYSSEKMGFMGSHHSLLANVQLPDDHATKNLTFFVKSIPYDNPEQVSMIQHSRAFYRETEFYKRIAPELLASIEDKSWIAKCHLVKNDALIFEDLKSQNFGLKEKILDLAQLKSVLTSLAKLHASSMLAEKRLGKTFSELYPEVLKERLFVRTGKSCKWFCSSVDVAVGVARKLKIDHNCVAKICDLAIDALSTNQAKYKVICHGDCWSNNLMFDDSKPTSQCIIVDYQVVRYLSGSADVALLMYLTTLRPFREMYEVDLLKFYHGVLSDTLKKNNDEIQVPSFHDVLQDYEEMRVVGITTAALCLPLHLMDLNVCRDLMSHADGFAKMIFEDHVEFVIGLMSRDELYNLRISEIVIEMVEKSGQLLQKKSN